MFDLGEFISEQEVPGLYFKVALSLCESHLCDKNCIPYQTNP